MLGARGPHVDQREIATFIDYNYWANHKVLDAAANLTTEQFAAPGRLSFGSVRGTLLHVLFAEDTWRQRIEGAGQRSQLQGVDFPDLASLRTRWTTEEAAMRRLVRGATPERLAAPISYTSLDRSARTTPLWQILLHVVNHGTQFRGEAGVLLTELGHSPGDLDFIQYVRPRK
jgi:uncharacterized damage-inducible protein DinB